MLFRSDLSADHAVLDALAAQVAAATTRADLDAVRQALVGFSVRTYRVVLQVLGRADDLAAAITDLQTTYADDPVTLATLTDARTALDAARADALALSATSARSDVRAVCDAVRAVADTVESLTVTG